MTVMGRSTVSALYFMPPRETGGAVGVIPLFAGKTLPAAVPASTTLSADGFIDLDDPHRSQRTYAEHPIPQKYLKESQRAVADIVRASATATIARHAQRISTAWFDFDAIITEQRTSRTTGLRLHGDAVGLMGAFSAAGIPLGICTIKLQSKDVLEMIKTLRVLGDILGRDACGMPLVRGADHAASAMRKLFEGGANLFYREEEPGWGRIQMRRGGSFPAPHFVEAGELTIDAPASLNVSILMMLEGKQASLPPAAILGTCVSRSNIYMIEDRAWPATERQRFARFLREIVGKD